MSSYTLPELVEYALRFPEVGAVNFNALYVVLKSIIEKCGLSEEKVECTHPRSEQLRNQTLKGKENNVSKDSREDLISENDVKLQASNISDESTSENEDISTSTNGDTLNASTWKDLAKRIDDLEEKLNNLTASLVDLKKDSEELKVRKIRYEEGQKRVRNEGNVDLTREEFEDALDDLGEAVSRVAFQLKKQKESAEGGVKAHILREMCHKVLDEELSKHKDPVNKRLEELALTVRKLQRLFKEVIYPEAAGITKCLTCGRKAQISFIKIMSPSLRLSDTKQDLKKNEKETFSKRTNKENRLKFTLVSLNKLQDEKDEEKPPASLQEAIQDNESSSYPETRTQRFYDTEEGPLFNAEEIVSFFVPLRFQ